jgi:hypothetical protein
MKHKNEVDSTQKLSAHLVFLLHTMRSLVEKYDGTIEFDVKNNALFLNIPESKKGDCFKELEETIGSRQKALSS